MTNLVYVIAFGTQGSYVHGVRFTAEEAIQCALDCGPWSGNEDELRRTGKSSRCTIQVWDPTGNNIATYDEWTYEVQLEWTPVPK